MPDMLNALDALIEEAEQPVRKLRAARAALDGKASASTKPSKPKRRRRTISKRRRKGGTRADHALALVVAEPGITASKVAEKLKIKPNYMYRVFGDLQKAGHVRKDGRRYYPVVDPGKTDEQS